jgi:HAD superfamily hydrolase (TIGR01509 family)
MLSALLWDVDGTLAETERPGHLVAFNRAFSACGVPWRWDGARYGELLDVAGGRERLLHDMDSQPAAPSHPTERRVLAQMLHEAKCEFFAQVARSAGMQLRAGVHELLLDAMSAGMRLGIVSTSSRRNVDAVLSSLLGSQWRQWFEVVVCAEDVVLRKPHPEPYRLALAGLRLNPWEVLAIEDSPRGAAAARAAGIPVVVSKSEYFSNAEFAGRLAIGPSFDSTDGWSRPTQPDSARIGVAQLRTWHSAALPQH